MRRGKNRRRMEESKEESEWRDIRMKYMKYMEGHETQGKSFRVSQGSRTWRGMGLQDLEPR